MHSWWRSTGQNLPGTRSSGTNQGPNPATGNVTRAERAPRWCDTIWVGRFGVVLHTGQSVSSPPASLADSLRSRYSLERELGRGGMATVYLARDLKHDRSVALKVLHPELAATIGPARFLQEIQVIA